jgi:serine/threonine protein kinase
MNGERYQHASTHTSRYEIGSELGRGGMGIVYRAYEPALDRTIALKILAPELAHQPGFAARLRREAISTARLRHPNIALLYELGQTDETTFLAMEYIPGDSLRQLLATGLLPAERALNILEQIGQALDYAHTMGIVHRDIKPSNILVGSRDHAVLIDFGLAEMAESSLLTSDGAVLGTPHYMAPEQADGRGASAQSDQYGLAAVAYEMLTGVPPFHGRAATAVVYAHVHEQPPPPNERRPALPAAVNAVLLRALSKNPDERYPSLAAFVSDLRAALAMPVVLHRPRDKRPWLIGLAIGAAMLALVVTLLLRAQASENRPSIYTSDTSRTGVPLPQQVVWSYASRPAGGAAPVFEGETVVVDTLDGGMVALRATTGEVRWRRTRGGTRETIFGAPGVSSGIVFAGSIDEGVFGFSLESGGLIWRTAVHGAVEQAPTLDRDRLIVTTSKGYIYALQARSGQVIWGRPLEAGLQRPTTGDGQIFVGASRLLTALDAGSGTTTWEFEAASTITTQPVLIGASVVVGTERGLLYALRAADGQLLWRAQINGALSAAPAVSPGAIFVVDRAGGLTALSPDGKHVFWQFNAGAAINATPLLVDGKLFFGASNGILFALDAENGRVLGRMQLGGSVDTTPALGAGLIYVRADQVYALGS